MNKFAYLIISIVGLIAAIATWVFGLGFTISLGAFLLKLVGVTALNEVTFGMAAAFLVGNICSTIVAIVSAKTLEKNK